MQLPYLVTCEPEGIGLYQLSDGRFQMIQDGIIAPWMSGYRYLLVEQPLATYLAELGIERLKPSPAIVFNRANGQELHSHVCLQVGQFFQPNQLHDLPLNGLRLLTMNDEFIFASPELKQRLSASNQFPYLRFSEGLSHFAAG